MAATTSLTNNLRRDLFNSVLDFANDTFQMALYNGADHDQNTGAYTVTLEASGAGYTAKGETLTGVGQTTDTTNHVSFITWGDVTWSGSSITATECMVFDDTTATGSGHPTTDVSVYIGDFGGSKTSSSGAFVVTMPANTFSAALVRLA